MDFRQQVAYDDIAYELEGRFLSLPDRRQRYELSIKLGGETSKFTVLSDAVRLVEVIELPGKARELQTTELPSVQRPTDDAGAIASARQDQLNARCFPVWPACWARCGPAWWSRGSRPLTYRGGTCC
jgi:hypothetical protein